MDIKKLILRVLLLAIPFALFSALILAVDPYEQYSISSFVSVEEKKQNLFKHEDRMVFSNSLWKLNSFRSAPKKQVIFGDSRLSRFNESLVEQVSGEELFNFGITGGNYQSLFDSFWYADSITELKKVYFQVAYRQYSTQADWPVLQHPKHVSSSLLKYTSDKRVIASCFDLIISDESPDTMELELPEGDWEKKLQNERDLLDTFVLNDTLSEEFKKIAAHCRGKGIEMSFIVFPAHADVVKLYAESPHAEQRAQFIRSLSAIAPLHDFCVPEDPLTQERSDYRDPLHSAWQNNAILIKRLWGKSSGSSTY